MYRAYESIEFWMALPGESPQDWRARLLDDALLADVPEEFGALADVPPAVRTLNDFLLHPDPEVRATAVRAWACVNLAVCDDETVRRIAALVEDPSPEVRLEALRCCRAEGLRDALPAILRRLREDETVRDELRQTVPLGRSPMARELFQAVEALDATEAVPLLASLGITSRWLSRKTRSATACLGRYVPEAEGHTRLLPAQDVRRNPACPLCGQPLRILAVVEEPFAPSGAGPIPFYRCLSCATHAPLFIELGPPARPVGDTFGDTESCFRGPEPGSLPWALQWRSRGADERAEAYTPQLGGEPNWIQQDETPLCPPCGEKMDFVIKLPGEAEEFPLVEFQGVVYGFWCPNCRVTSTQFQV